MAAHPLAISGKAATRNRGFMIVSEQEMASALRGMTLATRGETRRTGAACSDIRRAVERREFAHDAGIVDEFADDVQPLAADGDAAGYDGHAGTEAAAAFLLGDFQRSVIGRGCVVAVRMVAARSFVMVTHLAMVIVGVQDLRPGP